jgi:hypothetical protein
MVIAQRRNRQTTLFSKRIPVVKRLMSVLCTQSRTAYKVWSTSLEVEGRAELPIRNSALRNVTQRLELGGLL